MENFNILIDSTLYCDPILLFTYESFLALNFFPQGEYQIQEFMEEKF